MLGAHTSLLKRIKEKKTFSKQVLVFVSIVCVGNNRENNETT